MPFLDVFVLVIWELSKRYALIIGEYKTDLKRRNFLCLEKSKIILQRTATSLLIKMLHYMLQVITHIYIVKNKECASHILAPAAVAYDNFIVRRSAHPAERFMI